MIIIQAKEIIKNVKAFKCRNNELLVRNNLDILYLNRQPLAERVHEFDFWDKYIYYYAADEAKTYWVDPITQKILQQVDGHIHPKTLGNDTILGIILLKTGALRVMLYQIAFPLLNGATELCSLASSFHRKNKDTLYYLSYEDPYSIHRRAFLNGMSLKTVTQKWTIPVSNRTMVYDMWQDYLLIAGEESLEQVHVWLVDSNGNTVQKQSMPYFDIWEAHFNEKTGILSSFWKIPHLPDGGKHQHYYAEIHLTNNGIGIKYYGLFHALTDASLRLRAYTIQEHYVYFTAASEHSVKANVLGILDRDSLQIVAQEEVELEHEGHNFFPTAPVVDGNLIYVLDRSGALHIFEHTPNCLMDEELPF